MGVEDGRRRRTRWQDGSGKRGMAGSQIVAGVVGVRRARWQGKQRMAGGRRARWQLLGVVGTGVLDGGQPGARFGG